MGPDHDRNTAIRPEPCSMSTFWMALNTQKLVASYFLLLVYFNCYVFYVLYCLLFLICSSCNYPFISHYFKALWQPEDVANICMNKDSVTYIVGMWTDSGMPPRKVSVISRNHKLWLLNCNWTCWSVDQALTLVNYGYFLYWKTPRCHSGWQAAWVERVCFPIPWCHNNSSCVLRQRQFVFLPAGVFGETTSGSTNQLQAAPSPNTTSEGQGKKNETLISDDTGKYVHFSTSSKY